MKQRLLLVVVILLSGSLLAAQLTLAHHDIPAWLTQNFAGPTYRVYYATSCPPGEPLCTMQETVLPADADSDGTPDAVEEMSGYLEDFANGFHDHLCHA